MLTVENFNGVDIKSAFQKHLLLGEEQANTHEGEYWTGCPFCGTGEDRFKVWPYRTDSTIHYWCRQCNRSGDIVHFLQEIEHRWFLDICEELNIDLGIDYASLPQKRYEWREDEPPSQLWQDQARKFAQECITVLWSDVGKNARSWLYQRGLTDEAIKRANLGYNPTTRWDEKKVWGISESDKCKKVWLPRGITIPWIVDRYQIWKINIRRPNPDVERDIQNGKRECRYMPVKGSSKAIYGLDSLRADRPTLVVEGEFDKLIASQVLGEKWNVFATGSTSHGRTEQWTLAIAQTPLVLIGFDADKGKGEKAAKEHWLKHIPHALLWQPWAKDVNEMHMNRLNIAEWVNLGLSLANSAYGRCVDPVEIEAKRQYEKDSQESDLCYVCLDLGLEVPADKYPCPDGFMYCQEHHPVQKRMEVIDGVRVWQGYTDEEIKEAILEIERKERDEMIRVKRARRVLAG